MIIYDFFAGTGSATKAFEDAGHKVIKVELDPYFEANERDIMAMTGQYLMEKYGRPDFIWASPPCTSFSIASVSHHWTKDKQPKSLAAEMGIRLVGKTISLINELNPILGFVMENPRGMLRKFPMVDVFQRTTITYCRYGDFRMKPTDLWFSVPNWQPRPMCKNGDKCHQAAPRGSKTGTQGLKGAKTRSMVPYQLGKEILECLTSSIPQNLSLTH
jgi:hypothetical protein